MGARGPVEVRVVWVPGAQWRLGLCGCPGPSGGWGCVGARGPVEVRVVWVPGAQWRLGLCGCPGPSGG